jgi:hypothetical protein
MKQFKIFLASNHFWIFVFSFISLFTFVEFNNDKLWTNDFKVYYLATIDFFKGNDPYNNNYGLDTGYFKYPPFTFYLFKVFTLFKYEVAQLIQLLLLTFSLCLSFLYTKRLISILKIEFKTGIFYLGFIVVAIHLVREFHMGNINLYLLVLFLAGLYQNQKKNKNVVLSALFWGIMLILKPITILSLILLVFYKEWKTIIWMSGLGILFFLFPILSKGWEGSIKLWTGWLDSISSHGEYIVSENSLTYLANYYFGIQSQWSPSIFFLLILIGIFLFDFFKTKKVTFIEWTIIFTSFSPNFFVTDTQHFLLSLPLILLYLARLKDQKNTLSLALFIVVFILFSINSNDLWGKELSSVFDAAGILGLGNLLLISGYLVHVKILKR